MIFLARLNKTARRPRKKMAGGQCFTIYKSSYRPAIILKKGDTIQKSAVRRDPPPLSS